MRIRTLQVELDSMRLKKTAAAPQQAASTSAEADGPKLPKQMEIRPDDSEEVVARKKKKLNMFRRQVRARVPRRAQGCDCSSPIVVTTRASSAGKEGEGGEGR